MAMTKCRECGKDVSTEAKVCPHCGVENPGIPVDSAKKENGKESKSSIFGWVVGIIIMVFLFAKCSADESPEDKAKKELSAAECRQDLQCWGDKNSAYATAWCDDQVERLAKNSHKWTDGTFDSKFSHFRWLNKDAGTLTYIGDKIQYQNGFGAWVNHVYECDFDPDTKTVLDVRAREGRL